MNRFPEPDDPVLYHELAHIRQFHSVDLILIQLVKIFQWFNPFLFFAEKAMQETHEYLADASVMEQDGEADRYRLLLLSRVFGVQPGIFSFFNHSRIKNRMIMLTKQKSPISHRFKYLSVLPVFVLLFLAISCQKKTHIPEPVTAEPDTAKVNASPQQPGDEPAFVFVEKQAEFQGGDIEQFREWVQKNLVYPPEAIKAGIFGKVTLQFGVDENGKVGDIKILRGVAPSLDKAAIKTLQSSPDWISAQVGGKNVKQQFVMPVIFMLQ
jgi:TonB family protein